MKKLVTLSILSLILSITIQPLFASALTFRRPIETVLSPLSRAYYDDNSGPSAQRFTCGTDNVYNEHKGTDFRAVVGTPIYSGASGNLYYRNDGCSTYGYRGSRCGGGFGNHVRIDHEGAPDGYGWVSIYAHMQRGTPVGAQSLFCSAFLGLSGSSGDSDGPHVHFEVRKNGYPNDDPYVGACSSSSGYWTSVSSGIPSAMCGSEQMFRR